ncbi:MAG TPA: hypothetical protein VJ656_02500 [Pyrinomonadaceae bacterium]|nr:hypothetical protein [Pyrinomonadaceae bacterium]
MSTIINEDKEEVRRYLLGQLDEAGEERLELRLLTDFAFSEEFDTIVDEIADQYAGEEFEGEAREQVEEHFLKSEERQQKVEFARELMQRAATARTVNRVAVVPAPTPTPRFMESVRAFLRSPSLSLRIATAMATLIIVVGLAFLARPLFFPSSGVDELISLNISSSDRASGSERESVRLEPGTRRLRIELKLPDQIPQAQNYRVELLDSQQRSRNLPVEERTAQSIIVAVQANEMTPGSYIIQLWAVNPDGTEQRIRGNYGFNVL